VFLILEGKWESGCAEEEKKGGREVNVVVLLLLAQNLLRVINQHGL